MIVLPLVVISKVLAQQFYDSLTFGGHQQGVSSTVL